MCGAAVRDSILKGPMGGGLATSSSSPVALVLDVSFNGFFAILSNCGTLSGPVTVADTGALADFAVVFSGLFLIITLPFDIGFDIFFNSA